MPPSCMCHTHTHTRTQTQPLELTLHDRGVIGRVSVGDWYLLVGGWAPAGRDGGLSLQAGLQVCRVGEDVQFLEREGRMGGWGRGLEPEVSRKGTGGHEEDGISSRLGQGCCSEVEPN